MLYLTARVWHSAGVLNVHESGVGTKTMMDFPGISVAKPAKAFGSPQRTEKK